MHKHVDSLNPYCKYVWMGINGPHGPMETRGARIRAWARAPSHSEETLTKRYLLFLKALQVIALQQLPI